FTATQTSEAIAITGVTSDPDATPIPLVTAIQVRALSGTPGPSKFANISTRAKVEPGDNALIAGFITTGQASKTVIFRAIGPSLSPAVAGVLADPILDIYDHTGSLVGHNDNWRSTQQQEIIDTGIPPTNDLESALIVTLSPGAYTAVVTGAGQSSGVAL